MFCEAKDDRTNDIEISFIVPQERWNEMKTTAEWKTIEEKIAQAKRRNLADIYYKRLPLIEEKMGSVEVMVRKLMIALILPIISLIISVLVLFK